MKAIVKFALICAASAAVLAPSPSAKAAPNFEALAAQRELGARQENRIREEIKRWRQTSMPPSARLMDEVRSQFNLNPRNGVFRKALEDMIKAGFVGDANLQSQEERYYKLLNLVPTSKLYKDKLASLLYRKHGGHSAAQVKNAYSALNKAFNTWDKGRYDDALALMKQARLPKSPEMTALYAYHLRDRGNILEAMRVLKSLQPDSDYLGWLKGSLRQIIAAQSILDGRYPESDKIGAQILLGQLDEADRAIKDLPDSALKNWFRAKWYEKQGQYHPASQHYQKYYRHQWAGKMPGFVPVVYKVQLEDVNSLDLIALKFRTSVDAIRKVNQNYAHDWVETYRMLVIPVIAHDLSWPTYGNYVSSHFGYRLHPIYGTWRLHEGIDIETLKGDRARAAAQGQVIISGYDRACGNMVRMQHSTPQIRTTFCHAEKLLVKKGERVQRGRDVIVTGTTGSSASIHLHFGVQLNGRYVDPMDWL